MAEVRNLRIINSTETGLSVEEQRVLNFIRDRPGFTLLFVAQQLQMDIYTLSGTVSSLHRKGLIKTEADRFVPVWKAEPDVLWGYESEVDEKRCERCEAHARTGTFTEEQVIDTFPWLRKVGTYSWRPMEHPHCRCRLIRLVGIR